MDTVLETDVERELLLQEQENISKQTTTPALTARINQIYQRLEEI
jgi:hypothetical protein